MNFIFLMDAPETATTGVLDHGLPAAESVDQVSLSEKHLKIAECRSELV